MTVPAHHQRLHIYYSGLVQGVGFRYTAERLASQLGITGWVRNRDDGRVEFLGEATTAVLNEFIEKIDRIFHSYIRDTALDWRRATGEFTDFEVRFDA